MTQTPDRIYHMAHEADWQSALEGGQYFGSPDDKRDGFIHFSSAAQVVGSAAKHRAGQSDLILIEASCASLGPALVWEKNSPDGQAFPHLYAAFDVNQALRSWPLPLGEDGLHVFPDVS
jgi:uncharacterized protein (DUF952 family)